MMEIFAATMTVAVIGLLFLNKWIAGQWRDALIGERDLIYDLRNSVDDLGVEAGDAKESRDMYVLAYDHVSEMLAMCHAGIQFYDRSNAHLADMVKELIEERDELQRQLKSVTEERDEAIQDRDRSSSVMIALCEVNTAVINRAARWVGSAEERVYDATEAREHALSILEQAESRCDESAEHPETSQPNIP